MKIKNFESIALSPLRKKALFIAEEGLQSIDTSRIIRNLIKKEDNFLFVSEDRWDLSKLRHIFVVAVGKCALLAALTLEDILKEDLTGGVVLDIKTDPPSDYPKFAEFLVEEGIESISLNPDTVLKTTQLIYQKEKKMRKKGHKK